jgi:inner membrane protein
MASIGHVVVGMAAARIYQRRPYSWSKLSFSMTFWGGLSLLPDIDVIGFRYGVRYADPLGHRGATHSLLFALAAGIVVGAIAAFFRRGFLRTTAIATLLLITHPLLDTLTDGGLGCALLWPFDAERFFAPWNPIPVAPIGMRFFSAAGLRTALFELALFSPILLFAIWPRDRLLRDPHSADYPRL